VLALGIAAGLAFGLAVGLFNGLLVTAVGVNPFIATFASLNICLGPATTISGGEPVFGVPDSFSDLLADDHVFRVRVPVAIAACVMLIAWFGLTRTVFGRAVHIIGSNPRAATVAGLPARLVLEGTYVACSLLDGIGGP
jgi:ribose transport system permease protein